MPEPDRIVERVERQAGVPGLARTLAALPQADLASLLLAVVRGRSAAATPAGLLRQQERDRFVRPAAADPAALARLELAAYAALPPSFRAVELAPLAPAATTALGGLSPDLAVATVRGTEVLSDVTNALALEAALLRRRDPDEVVRLAACARVVRPQRYEDPALLAHFRLFGLVTAGRAEPHWGFERGALAEHLDFYRRFLGERHVEAWVTPLPPAPDSLWDDVRGATLDRARESGRGYYRTASLAVAADGAVVADGGFVDWTARLLGNAKERLLISGIGLERLV